MRKIKLKRWLLVYRNHTGGADFVLDSQYPSRSAALWNKKRQKLQPGWRPVRFRIIEV